MAGLDASNLQNENDVKGQQRPDPGMYHFVVNHMDASFDKHDAVIADLEVLAGKPDETALAMPDQRGRGLRHMMFLDEDGNYVDKHLRFALATGILKPGEKKDVDWSDANGRQLVGGVEKRTGKNRKGEEQEYANVSSYGLDLWSVGNPEVAHVPKDEAALKLMEGGAASNTVDDYGKTPGPAGPNARAEDPYADI
jgi:hypothetical protein